MEKMKLYIAILDEVPDNIVPCLVAHSVIGADRLFTNNPEYKKWFRFSFKKCVVRVNRKEFSKIKALPLVYLGHENSTLGGEKCCAIVCPMEDELLPNVLKRAKLWSPVSYELKIILTKNEMEDKYTARLYDNNDVLIGCGADKSRLQAIGIVIADHQKETNIKVDVTKM